MWVGKARDYFVARENIANATDIMPAHPRATALGVWQGQITSIDHLNVVHDLAFNNVVLAARGNEDQTLMERGESKTAIRVRSVQGKLKGSAIGSQTKVWQKENI